MAIAWSGQLLFDLAVFLLTLWRSLRVRTPGSMNLVDVFLRDGVHVLFGSCCNID
ncbi:hypothetical protein ID866_8379 [Astraeus odoratus]|nr:hypothetical protein ID866_8379 [Astraeus odoratus]